MKYPHHCIKINTIGFYYLNKTQHRPARFKDPSRVITDQQEKLQLRIPKSWESDHP